VNTRTIIIVDDDAAFCDNLEDILQESGYKTFSANTYAKGLNLACDLKPQVVLLDIVLPDGLGTRLLHDLKQTVPDCVCIMITAHADIDNAISALENGAFHYLQKPVRPEELLRLLERAFEMVQLREEKKQADEALQKSEERYHMLFNNANDAIFVHTMKEDGMPGKFIEVNDAACIKLGYTKNELLNLSPPDIDAPEKNTDLPMLTEKLLTGKHILFEQVHLSKDGRRIPVEINSHLFYLHGEQTILSIARDITRRRQAEEALKESEEKYRTLVENVNIGVFRNTLGSQGWFIQANPAMLKIFGYDSFEEFRKIFVSDLYLNPEERELFIEELLKNGFVNDKELRLQKKDGTPIWASVTASLRYDEKGDIKWIDGVLEDITGRKHLEDQLRHAQKMEAIGTLAGGIAHDFNNVLTAIIGYGNLLKDKMGKDIHSRKYLDTILASADRAAILVRSLLAFSRKQNLRIEPVDLNHIIVHLNTLLLRIIEENIELKIVTSPEVLTIMADAGQMEQVLMNLATNARDAMPAGGILTIETKYAELGGEYLKMHSYVKPGVYALLSVSDTGTGMNENTKQRIFEPFFTTKEVGKGTGLGLAMIYGIIKQHDGYIDVYSEPGEGTTFKIYLPVIKAEVGKSGPLEIEDPLKGGSETILIAEDDNVVRNFTKDILEGHGYKIIEAVDGEDAVNKFLENKDRVQMLVLDVIMPKKDGSEVFDEIKKIQPDIKAIFMSGYTADVIQRRRIIEEGLNFVSKPLSPVEFLRKIRDTLDQKG
jgi:PAS domain S-box-containing protein